MGDNTNEEVLSWIQERITCHTPDPKTNKELYHLVTTKQLHKTLGIKFFLLLIIRLKKIAAPLTLTLTHTPTRTHISVQILASAPGK